MSATQLDELPENNDAPAPKSGGGNLVPALIAIILAPALTVGAMFLLIKMNKPEETIKPQITEGGQPLDMEPSGQEKFYELKSLITNLGGPIKSRYFNLELKIEGQAGDFEKADLLETRIIRMLRVTYGGEKLTCWLSGLKRLMVDLGVFRTWSNHLDYPLTTTCAQNVKRLLDQNREDLLPPLSVKRKKR